MTSLADVVTSLTATRRSGMCPLMTSSLATWCTSDHQLTLARYNHDRRRTVDDHGGRRRCHVDHSFLWLWSLSVGWMWAHRTRVCWMICGTQRTVCCQSLPHLAQRLQHEWCHYCHHCRYYNITYCIVDCKYCTVLFIIFSYLLIITLFYIA